MLSLSTSEGTPWAGLLIRKVETSQNGRLAPFFLTKPLLGVIIRGKHDVTWRQSGTAYSRRCQQGSYQLVNAPVEISEFEEHAGAQHLLVDIDASIYQKWNDSDYSSINFPPLVAGEEGTITFLVRAIQDEVERGCPSGALFSESISVALVNHLEVKYARPSLKVNSQGLSCVKLRYVQDFILRNLSQQISLGDLAQVAGLSPQHLCRSFKKAAGVTPYQYILRARIAKAKVLLLDGNFSVADAALAVGFSSQSHFSDTFRQFTGMSPRQFQSTSPLGSRIITNSRRLP